MKIIQVLHSAIVVTDLVRSQWFYETVLGLVPVERPLTFPGAWYQLGSFQVHLLQADQVIADGIDAERWGRNRHLAFSVENLDGAIAQLQAHQWPFQKSASGREAVFVRDPDGNILELQFTGFDD
jgi:glyoxylase I family protein